MLLLKNNKVIIEKWNELLSRSVFASPFQTLEFYNFYNSLDNYSADVFAVEVDNEYKALVVVTIQQEQGIKSFFSKRGIIYGGPILQVGGEKYLSFLKSELVTYYTGKIIYLEVRNNHNYQDFSRIYNDLGWIYKPRLNVQLNLGELSLNDILSGMKYNRRREINLSYKEGVIVRAANNEVEVLHAYHILKDLYQMRVKLPLPSQDFFLKLYDSDIGKIFVVVHNDEIIGGSFNLFYKGLSINTLYYCGLRDYHKKIFPTHLAIMGVIEFAIQNYIPIVDFMGAGKPDEDYGVRDYKLQFGGELVEHGRFVKILNPLLFKTGKIGLSLMAKLK